jgi:hypothetical protein
LPGGTWKKRAETRQNGRQITLHCCHKIMKMLKANIIEWSYFFLDLLLSPCVIIFFFWGNGEECLCLILPWHANAEHNKENGSRHETLLLSDPFFCESNFDNESSN